MNPLILHTETLATFNEKYFEKVITEEHITSDGSVAFPKVKATDGEELEINFFGWIATKDGVSWMIPSIKEDGTHVKLKEILPLVPTKFEDVGYQSKAYKYIHEYQVVKFKKEDRLGMKGLVDAFCSIPHSNPDHRKLLVMSVLSQYFNRAYFRFSSPPGFGKDSIVDTLGLLVGGCATIENPSVPKLEREASIRTLTGVNEVVGISKSQWTEIGKFILAACAFKPNITKRTRAFGGVGEVINLRNYSMSLFYNDIDCYVDKKVVYFDDLAEAGIRDRLPAMRLYGNFTYDFNEITNVDVDFFVDEYWDDIKDIIYTMSYFKNNLSGKILYDYDLSFLPQRWQRSIGLLLMVVQEYVSSQEEFDYWLKVIKDSIVDYNAMLEYPKLLSAVSKKVGKKEFNVITESFKKEPTFINRITVLLDYLKETPVVKKDKNIKGYW